MSSGPRSSHGASSVRTRASGSVAVRFYLALRPGPHLKKTIQTTTELVATSADLSAVMVTVTMKGGVLRVQLRFAVVLSALNLEAVVLALALILITKKQRRQNVGRIKRPQSLREWCLVLLISSWRQPPSRLSTIHRQRH